MKTLDEYHIRARQFEKNTLTPDEAIDRAVFGLTGEVGELAEHLKKAKYEEKEAFSPTFMIDELGDVLWYVVALAEALNTSLRAVANRNIQKLSGRYE